MNPNYNQQPPYQYQQHTPGPAQPPWQQDPNRRTGWQDPRFNNPQSPPPPSTSPSYQPVSFGPISGQPLPPPPPPPPHPPLYGQPNQAGVYGQPLSNTPPLQQGQQPPQYDTSNWGVRYNQNVHQQPQFQHQDTRPTLPPRPSSKPPEGKPVTSSWNRPALVPLPDGTWQFPQYLPADQNPPTPPPRPHSHATNSYLPQGSPSLSHRQSGQNWSSTHNYSNHHQPSYVQPPAMTVPSWNTPSQASEGTVSPIDDDRRSFTMTGRSDNVSVAGRSDTVSPVPGHRKHASKQSTSSSLHQFPGVSVGATTLGPGSPSDWQHYQASEVAEVDGSRDQNNPTPTESVKPVQTLTSSPQPMVATPVAASDGPAHAYVQIGHPTRPDTAPTSKADIAIPPTHSPDLIPSEKPINHTNYDSSQTSTTSSPPIRAGTIDSVIQAWNAPLQTTPKVENVTQPIISVTSADSVRRAPVIKGIDQQCQTDFPPEVRTETKVETRVETIVETKEIEIDPYSDIKNEYNATLKRFAGMLRQEASAETDEEKFKIFQGFVIRELRLRGVLYGMDAQPLEQSRPVETVVAVANPELVRDSGVNPVEAMRDTNQPASVQDSTTIQEPNNAQTRSKISVSQPPSTVVTPQAVSRPMTPPQIAPLSIPERNSAASKDETAAADEAEYSPGGRPRITPARRQTNPPKAPAVIVTTTLPHSSAQAQGVPISPGANAPMTLDDYVMPNQPASPLYEAPIVVTGEDLPQQRPVSPLVATLTGPLNFQPPRPTYTPFRHGDRSVSPLPTVVPRSPDETYNSLRQSQAAESGRMLSNEVTTATTASTSPSRNQSRTPGRVEHEEAFIGLIRRESKAIRKRPSNILEQPVQLRTGTPMISRNNTPAPAVISPLTKAVRSLRHAVPKTFMSEASAHPKLEPITTGLSKMPDEFNFINATVVAWDQANRAIRSRLDEERSARQTKSETRVNELFEDNEIGYADIGALEAEFKLNEAEKKYQEDKLELESFVKDVYEKVVGRIEIELGDLVRLRLTAADLLESASASAGNRFQSVAEGKGNNGKVPMTDLMDLILQLHTKIELRHQKIAEAQFERERRRKRLELSVLYTNGDTPAVKKLEKEFSEAQLRLFVEEARKKDQRANKLMDAFDRAVVRGLAENQAWIDEAQSRLQLVRDLVLGSEEHLPSDEKERETLFYGADGIREIMSQTQSALDLVLSDSQKIVRLSNVVDMVLNEADYAMYLAEEKVAKSSPEKFEKLKQDKVKEDDKIRDDFGARMSGIDKAPHDLHNLIRDVNGKVGVDEGHKARIDKALEEAKRRNERHRGDSVSSPILSQNVNGTF